MDKILVTGADGFIGKHLVPKLVQKGYEVFPVTIESGDVSEESTWSIYPKSNVVIHLAGRTFPPQSWQNPDSFFRTNILSVLGALKYCMENNARLIFPSSYLYGPPKSLPIPETTELKPNNPYALSKKIGEDLCKFYSDNFGVKVIILRPFNVYGPGQSVDFLIPTILNSVFINKSIQVRDLEPKRDYVYIDDLIDAFIKSINTDQYLDIFNIGSGEMYSVADIINIIQTTFKTNVDVISANERRPNEVMETQADIMRAKDILGWSPSVSIHEGIKNIAEYNKKLL